MNKFLVFLMFTISISSCKTIAKTDFDEGYVTPAGYAGESPYWSNNYRLNTSNYFANRDFQPPGPEIFY